MKPVNYKYQNSFTSLGLNAGDCMGNTLKVANQDKEKDMIVGFLIYKKQRVAIFHGWLEDTNSYYEVTNLQQPHTKYQKIFSISYSKFQSNFTHIHSIDKLMDEPEYKNKVIWAFLKLYFKRLNFGENQNQFSKISFVQLLKSFFKKK